MLIRPFGASERPFRLKGAQWRDLEKARDCGLGLIAARLAPLVALKNAGAVGGIMTAIASGQLGNARLDDVREPILQGLIGGGLTSTEAGALIRAVFDEDIDKGRGPMFVWADLAFAIVTEALIGLADEAVEEAPPGEPVAAAATPKPRRSKTARPASPTSTGRSA